MQIDPRDLMLLAAIVDQGSMTAASEALGKAQPSLSRSLAAFERRVGQPLFEAGRRPLRPTPLGLELAAQGRTITDAARSASSAIATHTDGRSGSARVGGTSFFMDGVISGIIAGFQNAYPDVRIDQSYGYAETLKEQLSAGQIDMAICPLRRGDLGAPYGFEPILEGRNVIACAITHPLARRRPLNLEDIAPYPWVAPPVGSPLYEDLKNTLRGIGMTDFKVSFSGGTLSSILAVLMGSESITVLPYSVVFMQQHLKTITALPLPIHHPDRQLGLLWRSDRPMRPAVHRFKSFVRAEFQNLSRRMADHESQLRKRQF